MSFKITTISIQKHEIPCRLNVVIKNEEKHATISLFAEINKNAYDLTIREIEEAAKAEAAKLTRHEHH